MRTKLYKIIEESGYNPHQIAVALGFHKTTIYNHLKGRSDLGAGKARKLAEYLKIPMDDVYAD